MNDREHVLISGNHLGSQGVELNRPALRGKLRDDELQHYKVGVALDFDCVYRTSEMGL